MKNEHLSMIWNELVKAKAKHPVFCDGFTKRNNQFVIQHLRLTREIVEVEHQADDILEEELFEALEAYLEGRLDDCLNELAQCGAVIHRMMEFVQKEIDSKKEGGK